MIEKTYNYHKPSPEGLEKIKTIREAYSTLHNVLKEYGTPSRELAVAFTHLETSAMWGIKAVVCNDPASEVDPS
jgi:hypothetical protein